MGQTKMAGVLTSTYLNAIDRLEDLNLYTDEAANLTQQDMR